MLSSSVLQQLRVQASCLRKPHDPIPSAQGRRAEGDGRQARSLFYFHSPERDQPLNGKVWDTGDHKRVALPRLFYVPIVIAATCANWDVDTFRGWSLLFLLD